MPRPPHCYERAALATGEIVVDPMGQVWRSRRSGRPCAPYRADGRQGDGYRSVYLRLGGRRVRVLAHRLVYEALVGRIPDGYFVRQCNGDRSDNRPSNLVAVPPGALLAPRAATGASAATGVSDQSGGCAADQPPESNDE